MPSRRLSPRPPLIAGLALMFLLSACREQVLHNLHETQANRLIGKLGAAGIAAEKVRQPDGQWSLAVPRDGALQAISFFE